MLKHFCAFVLFSLGACYITLPILTHLGDTTTGLGDELVVAWIQNWVIHAISTGNILSIFNANLYYPYQNSLAFSDTFFTSSIIALIPRLAIGQPIVANNVTLISSLIMLGFSIYVLSYYLTKDFLASLLSGLLVLFSPAFLSNVYQLQMIAIVGLPIATLFFMVFLNTNKSRYLGLSLIAFLLQFYNSFLPAYFILVSYIIILIFYWFNKRKQTRKIFTKKNLLFIFSAIVLLIPIIQPYYQVSKEFHYVRDVRDAIHFAIQPEDLLYPGPATRLQPFFMDTIPTNKFSQNGEFKPGYLGLIFSLLFVVVIIYIFKNRKKSNFELMIFSSIGLLGLLLSLGPFLHIFRQTVHKPFPIPLPYLLFYYIAPGFQGFRNSARWEILFILAFAVVIGIVLSMMLRKYSQRSKVIIYLLLIVGIVSEFNFPLHTDKVPQVENFPKVYNWLETTPRDAALVELPAYNWGWWPYTQHELWREYYHTEDFRKTVNGYTGFSPPPWQKMIAELNAQFPLESSTRQLKSMGIDYIIVHKDEYDACGKVAICGTPPKTNGIKIIQESKKNKNLLLVKQFDNVYIFKLK
jgi:hypothetical protein